MDFLAFLLNFNRASFPEVLLFCMWSPFLNIDPVVNISQQVFNLVETINVNGKVTSYLMDGGMVSIDAVIMTNSSITDLLVSVVW